MCIEYSIQVNVYHVNAQGVDERMVNERSSSSSSKAYQGRVNGGEGRGREILSIHCHRQNDPCIKMGSDEIHFNVSLIEGTKSQDSVLTNQDVDEMCLFILHLLQMFVVELVCRDRK